ncbi:MAG: glycosyltransferase family 4 protein [Deltaproteobacteria bacterium]|nr:glycosyltransferase family 4 protein [Deltaproteobacteria bacterium]
MHILFLTHYFPPEVNAPASRTFENARRWVRAGHRVTVLTCNPSHPAGVLYPGYPNRLRGWETMEGIRVLRVRTYLSANKGFLRRTANYLSYMVSATIQSGAARDVDVVVSTSPQFFCGMAGLWVARLKRRPWVLEIRDLWPESIIAVGAMQNRRVIRFLESMETFLYQRADHIVSVTRSFKGHIEKRRVPPHRISVLTNGADLSRYHPMDRENGVREQLGLRGTFVASYIGTHGMAHGLETVLKAAELLRREREIRFLLVGDGAERERLEAERERLRLDNVLMLPQQPKEEMPAFLAASDACMVLLRKRDVFKTVIPSKIFEAMAMARPIILGVEGESRGIVEEGRCGLFIEPEDAGELARTVVRLHRDPALARSLGENGRAFVRERFDRDMLAQRYLEIIQATVMES